MLSQPIKMWQIEGNVFAVKKALVSISSRLQACQPIFKKKMVGNPQNMQTKVVPREALYRASNVFQGDISVSRLKHREVDPLESLHRNLSQPRKDSEDNKQQVVLKILCSKERIGRVIGNGRATIRALQSETGAFITLGSNRLDCDEGLFTITASEVGLHLTLPIFHISSFTFVLSSACSSCRTLMPKSPHPREL